MITPDSVNPDVPMRFKFAKALFAFLLLPGMVAFVIPLTLVPWRSELLPVHWAAVPFLLVGLVLLLWCVRDFYVAGMGTLAPWTPPQKLVVVGLYRWSRNPMYLAVMLILIGWWVWFRTPSLLVYDVGVFLMFQLRVRLGEEPWLKRVHGAEWAAYSKRVRRWL